MRKYEMLPIDQLVSDVPVDPVHTRELADSIMSRGQLNPVIVREETQEVIDGFHRIAAMKELGFKEVECVLTPCDDEGFWDFRIIQASLHKNVTFARAIDWIEEVFRRSPGLRSITERYSKEGKTYKNAYTLFAAARQRTASPEIIKWATDKAKMWGLAIQTIENWLSARESLEPSLLEEVRHSVRGEAEISPAHYIAVARELPTKPGLQRQVMEKIKAEDLSTKEIRTLSQALRRAEDKEEVQSILRQPVSRTEDQMVREAKVERLFSHPPVPEAREIIEKLEKASNVIELKLVWEQVATMATEVDLALLGSLNEGQKEELAQSGERCIQASQKVVDYLRRKLGRLIELPRKEF